ncbi:peritrophin-48 [Haematobia irritans]|uniref:peritrophin-48 n=1 Tax=Haematobia irritans TaxID=7368 RepID=UPI003F50115B
MGFSTHYTCALILAITICYASSAKLNMNHICDLVNDGLMISSAASCDTYYACRGGKATRQICAPGYFFDKEIQMCAPQDQVQCLAANAPACSGYSLGEWAPVMGSCTDFYYCSTNGPLRSNCPDGEYFNPTIQQCVYASSYNCMQSAAPAPPSSGESTDSLGDEVVEDVDLTVPVNMCIFIQSGIFFASADACTSWNKCENGVMIDGICPNGLEYNVITMSCAYPSSVTCSQVTNDPNLIPAATCTTKNAIKAGPTCDTYMVCDGSTYQLTQCPSGEYFDTVSQTCVDRLDARNNCDRCEGTTKAFVNMYSASNCTGYLYCVNGAEASSGYCTDGSYFDEAEGACVRGESEPLYGCCNPKYFNNSSSDSSNTTEADDETTDGVTSDADSDSNVTTDSDDGATTESGSGATTDA